MADKFDVVVSVGSVEPHWCDNENAAMINMVKAIVSVGSVEPHWCDDALSLGPF